VGAETIGTFGTTGTNELTNSATWVIPAHIAARADFFHRSFEVFVDLRIFILELDLSPALLHARVRAALAVLLLFFTLITAAQAIPRWLTLPPTPALPKADISGYAPVNGVRIWYASFGRSALQAGRIHDIGPLYESGLVQVFVVVVALSNSQGRTGALVAVRTALAIRSKYGPSVSSVLREAEIQRTVPVAVRVTTLESEPIASGVAV